MRLNNIIKFDLETRAKDLKAEGKTLEEISQTLTDEAKTSISLSTVYRYFESNEKAIIQAIEKNDKLKAKVADAEINTVTKRIEIIDNFLSIAEQHNLVEILEPRLWLYVEQPKLRIAMMKGLES